MHHRAATMAQAGEESEEEMKTEFLLAMAGNGI